MVPGMSVSPFQAVYGSAAAGSNLAIGSAIPNAVALVYLTWIPGDHLSRDDLRMAAISDRAAIA